MPKPPPLVEVGPPRPRNAILIHDDDDRSGGLGRDSRPVVGTGGQGGRRADEGDRFGGSERGRGGSSGGGHAARQSPLAPSSPAVVRAPRPHEVIELDDYDSGSERPEKVAPRVERRRLFKEEPIEYSGSDPEDARARARARVAASALGGSRKSSKRRRESKPHKAGGRGEPGGSGKQSIRRGPGRPRLHYSNDESSGAPRKKLKSAGRRRHHDHKGGGDRGRHDDAAPARQVGAVVASGARSRHDDRRKVASAAKYPASVGSDGSEDDDYPPYSNHRSSGSPAKVKSAGCRRQDHKAGDRGRHDGAPARQVGAVVASRSSGSPAKVKSAGCGRHSHKGGGSSDWRGSAPARQVGAAVSSRTRSRNGDDRRKVASEAKYVEEVISSDDNGGSRGNQEDDVVKGTNKVDDNGDNSEDMYKSVEEEDGNGVHDDSYAGVDEEENDDTTEPQEEEEEEEEEREEEEEEEESHEAGEEPRRTPSSNAKAGGSARPGGDGTPPIRKMKFEGLCLVDNADTTSAGEGVRNRTRSQRRCSDKKLLARGIFSKPYCIDVSESDPEEEVPPPAQTENVQPSNTAFGDDSDDDEDRAPAKKRRRRQQVFHRDDSGSESDRTLARNAKKGPSSGRAKNGGAPYRQQTAKEGCCQDYAGCSNPQRVKNNYAGNPADRGDPQMQGDVAFKKNSLLPHKGGKRWKNTQEKKAYDDLFNSMFDDLEKHHPNGSAPAAQAQEDTQPQPLLFSFGDEDEVEEEKSEYDKKMDELWGDLDLILEGRNDSQSPEEEQDEEGNGGKNPVNKATLCEPGKEHDFIENDQIGIVCRHCHFVQTEIRHVFPPMGNWSEERDPRADRELDRYVDDFNDMLKSNGLEEECCIVSHRSGPVWDLVPGVRDDMFPHQREAFEFMWNKLAGGTDIEQVRKNVKSDALSGCFISHAPGTGKTRLATTFVQSYLELFPRCSPVIIAPKVMLATWEDEFRKWNAKVPLHILNSTHICWDGDKTIQRLAANDDNLAQKLLDYEFRRDVMLLSWCEGNSVIALSYKLFTKFTKEEEEEDDDDDDDDTGRDHEKMRQLRKMLLRRTDLLVLDEGHIPRNRDSQIWKCLAQVRTEKRIFLSGTLFQNNFVELRNILCLLQGDCHSKLPGKDEDKGFWASLTVDIIDERVNEVRAKMEPFLHIHTGDILHKSLPGLRESVVILNPFPMQKKIIAAMEKDDKHCSLELEYKISLASVHPSLITCMKNVSDEVASIVDQPSLERIRLKPCEGVKARFVYEIVRRCYRLKERVLVFSQYLETLDLIREQLSREFHWTKDREILQMSGKVKVETRQSMMMAFNDMKSDAKVMLASTKACGEGIQLIGASRVVLLDVVWNPSVGKQAIGRAYRIGQQKIVHTYNLITEGTKEKSKFERQAKKDHMSKLLFSNESQPAQGNQSPQLISSDSILEDMTEDENLKEMFVNVLPSQWLSNLDLCVGGPQTPW